MDQPGVHRVDPPADRWGEPQLDLIVEVKLEGVPLFETWLGSFRTVQRADERWLAFLAELTDG